MAKSTKIIVAARVQDVLRLILAGAEFADIQQFGSDQGWNVCERQIRRYIESAHKKFAKATHRDREQLLGRHLMQRRALYARALKAGDLRTALHVLRDEAALMGLYPPTRVAATTPDGQALSLEQRQVHLNAIIVQQLGMAGLAEIGGDHETRGTASITGEPLGRGVDAIESVVVDAENDRADQDTPSTAS